MKTYKYVKVAGYTASLSLELKSLHDFTCFLDQHQYRHLFLLLNEEEKITHFAVTHQGALISKGAEGYLILEDYHEAAKLEFTEAAAFYDARMMGCKTVREYTVAMQSGSTDIQYIIKMRETGYVDGYAVFAELKKTNVPAAGIPAGNAAQLYTWATAHDFVDFTELREALHKGFTEGSQYRLAMEKGFNNAGDFAQALDGNFINAEDWALAQKIKARNHDDLGRYTELALLNQPDMKDEEKVFLVLLSKLPQYKKVSSNKLKELFSQQLDTYRYADTRQLPAWFTTCFTDTYTIVHFLQEKEEVRRYGAYDADGEYFETRRLQERKIIVDGSNVAYNSHGREGHKPSIANIIRMVQALKEKGFTAITVMCDASLPHLLEDPFRLKELEEMVTYIKTPAAQSADLFILDYIKAHRCLVVSNDTFRDWKIKDAWVAQNIDFYRLSFLLTEEGVQLPDIESVLV